VTDHDTTDHEVETIVRDTFRDHEPLVAGRAARLLPAVRDRTRRRRTTIRVVVVSAAAIAVLAGVAVAVHRPTAPEPRGAPPQPTAGSGTVTPQPTTGSGAVAPDGWRLESSLGGEFAVPADWSVNDYGCGMTDRPSSVRGGGPARQCLTPEPVTKELAILQRWEGTDNPRGLDPLPDGLAERPVQVSGVAGTRAEGTTDDGRHAGWVYVPDRALALVVRTRDADTTRRILDSLHLVEVDHAGCAIRRPPRVAQDAGDQPTFVVPDPARISVCYYGGHPYQSEPPSRSGPAAYWELLKASAVVTGDPARAVAATLNAAPAGRNPDVTECLEDPPVPDVVLHVWDVAGGERLVWITYSSCTNRGVDNGRTQVQVSHGLLRSFQSALHQGYAAMGDIPQ
jgi:hypothetical protein